MSMSNVPICRFFLRGDCKYGSSHCRFRHVFPDNQKADNGDGFRHCSPIRMENQPRSIENKFEAQREYTDVLNDLRKEILKSEQSGTWPLTSLGYGEYGRVPGFTDFSPEEVRYLYHASVKNGTVDKFNECYKNLQKTSQEFRNQFKSKTNVARKIVMDLCNGKDKEYIISESPYTIIAEAIQPALAIDSFSFAIQPPPERNTFTQTDDAFHTFSFGSTDDRVRNPNPFGNIQPDSVFGSHPRNIQRSNVFDSNPKNIQPNVFGSNPRNKQPANSSGNNLTVSIQQSADNKMNSRMYSSVGDLSKVEVDAFNAAVFEYGKLPLNPPPKEYC